MYFLSKFLLFNFGLVFGYADFTGGNKKTGESFAKTDDGPPVSKGKMHKEGKPFNTNGKSAQPA